MVKLPKDPMTAYESEIFAVTSHLGYIATANFQYYGIINSGNLKIVIGPTWQIPKSDHEFREIAFLNDLVGEEADEFIAGMKCINRMPFESILQMLCTINHVLNGEMLSLADIPLCDTETADSNIEKRWQMERMPIASQDGSHGEHNSFFQEKTILDIVRRGDTAALLEWIEKAPAIRSGLLASEQIRHRKNTFIVTAAIVSRAAIQGGMDVDDAFTLSDSYIHQCEVLTQFEPITKLQYQMVTEYTQRVERLRKGKKPTKLALEVSNYIQHHMSETITVEQIAAALFLSRPYLSRRFKTETGENLKDYIYLEKMAEARRLLRYSDKSIAAISDYLGFSSQSHFTKEFKKYVGKNPGEYRES